MATATPSTPPISTPSDPPLPKLPSNPTPLSAPQEQQVRDLYYKNVRAKCADEIKGERLSDPIAPSTTLLIVKHVLTTIPDTAFAACATGRTFTLAWACRAQKLSMNSCMVQYQGQDELDKARAEWFALAGERRRAKKELQVKIEEGRRKHHEWWNLDEEGKLQGKKVEEEGRRVER